MASSSWEEDEEWELVNDDGFVYKRKKRPRLDPTTSAPPQPDPVAEEKNRRERKKRALTKLKDRYQTEIHKWEHLSNTLKTMHEKTQYQQHEVATPSFHQPVGTPFPPVQSLDSTCLRLVDDLLAQAESQEVIIRDVSNLCDAAESLCNAQEEQLKKSFIDLPIWDSSPRELIKLLCE